MNKAELIKKLGVETQKLADLHQHFLNSKNSADQALERDARREDGSERQDRLHEQILQRTIERSHDAEAAYNQQEKLVKELTAKLA